LRKKSVFNCQIRHFFFQMEIQCEFKQTSWHVRESTTSIYSCIITDQQLPEENEEAAAVEFIGEHQQNSRNINGLYIHGNVLGLRLNQCQMTKSPTFFAETFKFLKYISINHSGLKEITNKQLRSFQGHARLYYVNLSHNDIEFLPGDLLEDMYGLNHIIVSHNKLKLVEPNIIDNKKDMTIDLTHNPGIDIVFKVDDTNHEEISTILRDKYIVAVAGMKKSLDLEIAVRDQRIAKNDSKMKNYEQKIAELEAVTAVTSLTTDTKAYLADDDLKDFTLMLDHQQIKIHKMVFAARSSVFANMIKNNPEAVELKLTDISMATLAEVLEFVYTDTVPNDEQRLMEVFLAAEKLDIKALKRAIAAKLNELLTDENAFDLLAFAVKHEIEELKAKSTEKIQKMFPDTKFKVDLVEQCEELKKIAEMKRKMSEMAENLSKEMEKLTQKML
jgi:hypothetical protein